MEIGGAGQPPEFCLSKPILMGRASPSFKEPHKVHPGEVPRAGIPNSSSRCALWTMLHPKGAGDLGKADIYPGEAVASLHPCGAMWESRLGYTDSKSVYPSEGLPGAFLGDGKLDTDQNWSSRRGQASLINVFIAVGKERGINRRNSESQVVPKNTI